MDGTDLWEVTEGFGFDTDSGTQWFLRVNESASHKIFVDLNLPQGNGINAAIIFEMDKSTAIRFFKSVLLHLGDE